MKTILAFLILIGFITDLTGAQTVNTSANQTIKNVPAPTQYAITARDANSRVWERTVYERTPSGGVVTNVHSYTELASGLNHLVNGQWVESKEWIDILPNGTAAATNGQHQAYFPGDIYDGAIELVTPDGEQLVSRPMGLSYFDGTNSVLIAELTNSIGVVVGNNQVVYPDAFTDFKADLRYTYTKAGFEQDIILRESPLTPESYGLNPATARLQVLTEFFDPPQPAMSSTRLAAQAGVSLTDQTLDFGSMQMIHGRAFLLGQNAQDSGVQVSKQWLLLDGRQFLVEEMPVDAIANGLAALPQTAMGSGMVKLPHLASKHLILPAQRLVKTDPKAMLIAKATFPAQGFVLDYQTVNSSVTNITFQGDTTYYISGYLNLYGTNTFEGGAVLKYTNNVSLTVGSANNIWLASSYRPVVFTAKDDNTVGDPISGSTGSPSGYYASSAIFFGSSSYVFGFSHFRIAYAGTGILTLGSATEATYADAQLVNCGYGIVADKVHLRNVLFSHVTSDLMPIGGIIDVQNGTFDSTSNLMNSSGSGGGFTFTNCIFANATNLTVPSGYTLAADHNGFYNCSGTSFGTAITSISSNPFQVAGAGSYYLTNGCSFHNAGTTNIDPVLLASLDNLTTYPPIVYSYATFSIATTFSPQAQRDTTGNPDLGYHYDPLDYVFGSCTANANLTFNVGTAAAWMVPSYYGIACASNAWVTFNGTATSPDQWVALDTVQEAAGESSEYFSGISCWATSPLLQANFTHFSGLAGVQSPIGFNYGQVNLTNCELYNTFGEVQTEPEDLYFANCLVFRPNWTGLVPSAPTTNVFSLQNCTIYGGNLSLLGSIYLSVSNSAFNGTVIDFLVASANCDYNSFLQGSNRLPIIGPHDVIVTNSYNWQSSWLGNFYLPTSSRLIDKGSTTADQVGLYHFTTQTNQTVEGTSQVDIGYHYAAVGSNGNPLDGDGDGIPDYLEDANGNGLVDTGETDWQSAADRGLRVFITRPRNGSILP